MIATLILATAVLILAGSILRATWAYMHHSHLEGLTEEDCRELVAPIADVPTWRAGEHPDIPEEERLT